MDPFDALDALLRPKMQPTQTQIPGVNGRPVQGVAATGTSKGNSDDAWAEAALAGACAEVAGTAEGSRNATLNTAAFRMGQIAHLIDPATVRAELRGAGRACGLPEHEIETILRETGTGALARGLAEPRYPAPRPEHGTVGVTLMDDSSDIPDASTPAQADAPAPVLRAILLTPASEIKPRPVYWLWKKRIALGTLSLLAGREGLGKSTLGYWMAARITRGELYGEYAGRPRGVLVCATEDSWEHTIVPRLMAAGADLTRVFRVEVVTYDDVHVSLSLPRDLHAVEEAARQVDAALLLLDPLMSRLGDLDTHRDAEVRQALEPMAALADRCGMAVLGLIHHNKSGSADPLQLVMGSKAFTAVARSVHTVIPDPDDTDGHRRLFGTPKNNLGSIDLPTFSFVIGSYRIDTEEGDAWTGQLVWGDERTEGIDEVMARAADEESGNTECVLFVKGYLEARGGTADRGDLFRVGRAQGFSESAMKRTGPRLKIVYRREGFQGTSFWSLPGTLPTIEAVEAP